MFKLFGQEVLYKCYHKSNLVFPLVSCNWSVSERLTDFLFQVFFHRDSSLVYTLVLGSPVNIFKHLAVYHKGFSFFLFEVELCWFLLKVAS